jgi:hypothetical protein
LSQTQIGNDIDGVAAGDKSGNVSFSSDGTIVAIGGPGNDAAGTDAGHVRVFENISGVWTQIGNDILGVAAGDNFGASLSLSSDGSILAIGAPNNSDGGTDAGHVRVFENISGVWTQIGGAINGDAVGYRMGLFVSLSNDGSKLAISGYACCGLQHGHPSVGKTHIYENISDEWTLIGQEINTGFLGISDVELSADGSVLSIASPGGGWSWTSNYYSSGVIVYKNISGVWTPLGSTFYWHNIGYDNIYGVSLSNNGAKIAIGGGYVFGPTSIKIYELINEEWVQQGEDIETGNYWFKISLSDNGNILAIGGQTTNVYKNSSGNWTQLGVGINEEATDDGFGQSLELSADGATLIVGAPYNDGNGLDAGHARVYDLSSLLSVNKPILVNAKLYPNPAQNEVTIQLKNSQELIQVNIYSNLGQFIQTSEKNVINTTHLASGLYYVEIITDQGKATKKLVIK